MPVTTTVPRMRRDARAGAGREPQRHAAEDERERCHQDRAQPQPRSFERGLDEILPCLEARFRELDDQNRVLRRQPDQHDDADLRIHVEVVAGA